MISVVIPIYNSEKYLHQCIDSILNQTYQDIEVILVDDGSTDSSGQICDEYAQKDARVRVIHQKNARIAAARNAGIEISTGEYITFIDSDDYIMPDTYEKSLALMEKYDADMIQWDLQYLVEDGFRQEVVGSDEGEYAEIVTDNFGALKIMLDTHHQDGRFHQICQCCNCVWPKLFKRHLFDNIRFPLGKEYEDLRIVHRLYLEAEKVVFVNRRFSVYRLRNDSVVHSMSPKGIIDGVEAFQDKYEMLKECESSEAIRLLSLAAHNFLASMISAYAEVRGKKEERDLRKIIKTSDGLSQNLCKTSEKFMYKLLRTAPDWAYQMVCLRRKIKKIVR